LPYILTNFLHTAIIGFFAVGFFALSATPAFANGEGPYRNGDFPKAYALFSPLAKDGVADAQYYIGLMYAKGQAVPQDAAMAVEWYQKAANQGHALAQNNLGYMYGQGAGVPRNFVNAHMWYSLAAAAGNVLSQENRDLIALKMSSRQIAKSQSQARDWMAKFMGAKNTKKQETQN
jgi:uncharacterized protein